MSGEVLIVDDKKDAREIAAAHLSQFGFQITMASDGDEAWSLISSKQTTFEVLITDCMMPNMLGTELIRKMLNQGIWFTTVILSSSLPPHEEPICSLLNECPHPLIFLQKGTLNFGQELREIVSQAKTATEDDMG